MRVGRGMVGIVLCWLTASAGCVSFNEVVRNVSDAGQVDAVDAVAIDAPAVDVPSDMIDAGDTLIDHADGGVREGGTDAGTNPAPGPRIVGGFVASGSRSPRLAGGFTWQGRVGGSRLEGWLR